ncbi:MAG: lysoplasmalogenase [Bacteroidota bacterium]
MKRTSLLLHLVFILIVLVELTGRIVDLPVPEYAVKPLIMIWISLYFILYGRNVRNRITALTAFFFSWLGDILLMFSDKNELFFFAGVGGFFVSQVFYILTFMSSGEKGEKGFIAVKPFWALPFVLYLGGIFFLLYPGLDGIMIPIVLAYALSLIGMSLAALNRKTRSSRMGFILVFVGSLFFVSSDSMLAVNKFLSELPLSGFLVMSTYIIAQYLIMRGLLEDKES